MTLGLKRSPTRGCRFLAGGENATNGVPNKLRLKCTIRYFKKLLKEYKNDQLQGINITATKNTHYSLQKAIKRMKQPQEPIRPIKMLEGKWARQDLGKLGKVETFTKHLETMFSPHSGEIPGNRESSITTLLMLCNTQSSQSKKSLYRKYKIS